jgi:hypothetical protein
VKIRYSHRSLYIFFENEGGLRPTVVIIALKVTWQSFLTKIAFATVNYQNGGSLYINLTVVYKSRHVDD